MDNSDVVYIELNNWFYGRDYPGDETIADWVNNSIFDNEEWVQSNKLCVVSGLWDMSHNWCITAPRKWVEENCPKFLSDDTYTYEIITYTSEGEKTTTYTGRYSDFVRHSEDFEDPDDTPSGQFGWSFLPYCEENIGITENNEYWSDADEDDSDEDDE